MSESAQYTALELEVKGNKNSSGFQTLDDLTKALQRLKSVQPANVKALAESVKQLTDTAGALSAKDIVRLNDLSYALKRIASLGKLNTNAPQVIQSVADAANRLSNETLDKLTRLGEAFEKISQMKGTKVKSAMNAIEPPALQNPEDKLPNTPTVVPGSEQEVEPAEIEEAGDAAEATSKKLITLGQALHMVKNAANTTIKAVKFFGNTFFSTLKTIGSTLKQAVFSKMEQRLNALHSILKRIGRIVFLKTIRGMISAIASGVKAGIDNLYQWSLLVDQTFANSMNTIATASMYLKNSIGAALAPAIEALAPVIDFVVDKFVSLLNIMNQIIALLTGQSYWTKAIKQPQQFADAANSAGGAAADAAKAIKLYLASFDELHVMDSPSGSGSGGGGGSGGGANYTGMFENVQFDTTLKDAIKNGDWQGLGNILADKLNDVTLNVDNWLNNTFKPWAETFAKALGDTINGFVEKYNWALLGTTVADGINAIVGAVNTFLTTTKWTDLGTNIGTAINSWFNGVNWNNVASMFGNKLNMFIDTVSGLVKKVFEGNNAVSIGQTIADAVVTWFQTVHWDTLAETFETGFNGAVKAFSTFVKDPKVWTEFKNALKAFEKMDLDIAGLADALSTVFINAVGAVDWFEFGKTIGTFIGSIRWGEIVPTILSAISGTLAGIMSGVWSTGDGKQLVALIATGFAAALAVEIGVQVVKANILKTVISSAITGAAGATAGAGAVGTTVTQTSIWTALAEAIGGTVTATGVMIAVPLMVAFAVGMSFEADNPQTPVNADTLDEEFKKRFGDPLKYISQHGDEEYKKQMQSLAFELMASGAFDPVIEATELAGRKMGQNLNNGFIEAGFNTDGVVKQYNTSATNAINSNKTGDVTKSTGLTLKSWLQSAFGWTTQDNTNVKNYKSSADKSVTDNKLSTIASNAYGTIKNGLLNAWKWVTGNDTAVTGYKKGAENAVKNNDLAGLGAGASNGIHTSLLAAWGWRTDNGEKVKLFNEKALASQKKHKLAYIGTGVKDAIRKSLLASWTWTGSDGKAVTNWGTSAKASQEKHKTGKAGNGTASSIKAALLGAFAYSSDGKIKTWTTSAQNSLKTYKTGDVADSTKKDIIDTLKSPFDYTGQNYATTIQTWITNVTNKLKNCLNGTNLGAVSVDIQYKETKKPTGQLQATPKAGGGVYYNGKWHNVQAFANGGQPSGELFLAREAGPELVGTIGGRTAVMNNDQIVASVSDGVYRAMTQAMSSGNGNTHVHLYIDGKQVYESVVDQNNQIYKRTGNSPLMV